MPGSKKFLDNSGLTLYDQNLKNYIDDIVENEISPAIDAKAADSVFGASGTNHSKGLVPDPGSTQGSTKFLREDGSWNVPVINPASMETATGSVTLSGAAQANWTQTDSFADDYIKNKPTLATVATSGSYNDLSNKPTIPDAQVQSNWNETSSSSKAYIQNKPSLATVATSGSYTDLNNKPSLATVATSGSYSDLSNKPTIPSVATAIADNVTGYVTGDQVYDYAEAKSNKTTTISASSTDTQYPSALAVKTYVDNNAGGFDPSSMPEVTVPITLNQTQVDWNQTDNTAIDYIKNKPAIPTVAQAIASGDTGYVTGDMIYDTLGDLETFLSNY